MTNHGQSRDCENGNAIVITLVLLVVAAVGVLAFMSGKMDAFKSMDKGAQSVASASDAEDVGANPEENPILASFDGEEIRRQDVIDLINVMPPQMKAVPIEQLFPMALEQLVTNKIIDKKADGADLDSDEEVVKQLALAKAQIVRTRFLDKVVSEGITEDRVKEEYQTYLDNFPEIEEVKAAHILVDDEKLAKDLIKKLNKGENFADLAQENSKDGSAADGGNLGYFAKNEVVPQFAEAAFALENGKYSKKPIQSDFGYHIIRVDEKRIRPAAEFEQIKPSIEQELRRAVFEEKVTAWKSEFDIERFDINGDPLPVAEPAAGDSEEAAPTDEGVEQAQDEEVEQGAEE
ncbi:MAG: peptidylprolyl isomerase [Alphaproteobacteria bacterium]